MKAYNTRGATADDASLRLEHGSNSIAVGAGGVAIVNGSLTAVSGSDCISINVGGQSFRVSDSGGTNYVNVAYSVVQVVAGSDASSLGATSLQVGVNGTTRAALAPTGLLISGLPSSSPGSKQFWYDPADGNRVKYTP